MEKIVIIAFAISALFCAVKFIELRVLHKPAATEEDDVEVPSLKPVFRDGILIFICSICAMFAIEQLTPSVVTLVGDISSGEILDVGSPKVFTNPPDF